MYAGELVEVGPARDVIDAPLHPYTQLLVKSTPDIQGDKVLSYIPGEPPDLKNPPRGCRFHPRCPFAKEICRRESPKPVVVKDRVVRCHLLNPIG
jgi:peptide/nickel transport system ATP-binding protein